MAAAKGIVLTVRGVDKAFDKTKVLHGIDMDLHDGQVLCLIGPSGSGKSTLLRCLNHLETIDAGEIRFRDELIGYVENGDVLVEASEKVVARQRSRIGMVFQSFNLFGHMTALENVMAGPTMVLRESAAVAKQRALDLLARVGLAERVNHYPMQLSGGQQQRVGIARALAMRPEVLLLDEPTSALDPELVDEVLDTIRELARSGTTMVIVTHELGLVRDIADRVVFMSEGRIVEAGQADTLFSQPQSTALRSFLRRHLRTAQHHSDRPTTEPV